MLRLGQSREYDMKTATSIRLFACTGLLATMSAVAAGGGQSPGLVNHYSGMFGEQGYVHSATPSLAYGGYARESDRRAIRNLALTVKDLTGSPAAQACKGFHKVGDCVAAAHASQNLGVSFVSLRDDMKGRDGQQLSAAIAHLRPDVDSSLEAAKALQQTRDDLSKA
jgi:hypothetical protein